MNSIPAKMNQAVAMAGLPGFERRRARRRRPGVAAPSGAIPVPLVDPASPPTPGQWPGSCVRRPADHGAWSTRDLAAPGDLAAVFIFRTTHDDRVTNLSPNSVPPTLSNIPIIPIPIGSHHAVPLDRVVGHQPLVAPNAKFGVLQHGRSVPGAVRGARLRRGARRHDHQRSVARAVLPAWPGRTRAWLAVPSGPLRGIEDGAVITWRHQTDRHSPGACVVPPGNVWASRRSAPVKKQRSRRS